ncbi:MAG: blue light sensor protein [Gammaproteobacteria bacterium HGW-Gammaproteobacteria-8]|nr:MAG: blue light sensor protein [Gammaproteobacteria bacterium HGW-Gammaproteobacteria-8]
MQTARELIGLAYCSTAAFPERSGSYGVHPEVNRILVHSRRNNRRLQVGGVLHFANGQFFQYIEGPADVVDCLYARICRDPRHREVRQLCRRPIGSRRFHDWSMKFVAVERMVDQVMRRHNLSEFDPYRFTPAIIDDLVVSCTCVADDAAGIEIEPAPRPPGLKGLLSRLFG